MSRVLTKVALLLVVIAALTALAVLPACSSGSKPSTSGSTGGSSSSGAQVSISNFAFSPSSVTVKVGESVTWTNNDSPTHTVVGDGGISSGDLVNGATYSKTFDTAGTFAYKCSIHPTMTGTVVVQ